MALVTCFCPKIAETEPFLAKKQSSVVCFCYNSKFCEEKIGHLGGG